MKTSHIKTVFGALALLFVLVGSSGCSFHKVAGNEVGVEENWNTGVQPESLPPKTYMINPFTTSIYNYPTSGQVFAMDGNPNGSITNGRDVDPILVNSLDNQQVEFDCLVTWRRDPAHVVQLHKEYRDNIEERLIRPATLNIVTSKATLINAIDLYSGEKLNKLKSDVAAELAKQLLDKGVIVDSFVVERPKFKNQQYTDQIEQRQVFLVAQSRAYEEQKANEANALAAKALAQADANKQIVAAEAAKQVAILNTEATAQQSITQTNADAANKVTQQKADAENVVIKAKAEAERNIAISEAQKQAEINRSVGIKAVGDAEAYAKKLLLTSYSVPGSDLYTRIQVANSLSTALSNVRYYPPNASFSVISSEFNKSLDLLVPSGPTVTPLTAAEQR
jgi:regulator of protease activity HflC (stomatin/prohibitin superfamily)